MIVGPNAAGDLDRLEQPGPALLLLAERDQRAAEPVEHRGHRLLAADPAGGRERLVGRIADLAVAAAQHQEPHPLGEQLRARLRVVVGGDERQGAFLDRDAQVGLAERPRAAASEESSAATRSASVASSSSATARSYMAAPRSSSPAR